MYKLIEIKRYSFARLTNTNTTLAFHLQGFYELIPQHLLKPFDERELELVIGGLGKIDINDWKKHTRLKHCQQDSNIVKWFWMAVESFDEEKRAR